MEKICTACNIPKSEDEYYVDSSKKSGRSSQCKSCRKEYFHDYWGRPDAKLRDKERRVGSKRVYRHSESQYRQTLKYREQRSLNRKRRREVDPKFRLHEAISARIRGNLRGGVNGKGKVPLNILLTETLGYSLEQLVRHIEKQFKNGMTWSNYGTFWHLDHKIPVAAFNFKSAEDIDFVKCWGLKNLQPLLKEANLSKKDKLNYPFQPSLAMECR
jgi:hypothetical protein